jgi:hypothetical protein
MPNQQRRPETVALSTGRQFLALIASWPATARGAGSEASAHRLGRDCTFGAPPAARSLGNSRVETARSVPVGCRSCRYRSRSPTRSAMKLPQRRLESELRKELAIHLVAEGILSAANACQLAQMPDWPSNACTPDGSATQARLFDLEMGALTLTLIAGLCEPETRMFSITCAGDTMGRVTAFRY